MNTALKLTILTISTLLIAACGSNNGKGKQNSKHGLINTPPKAQTQSIKTDEDTKIDITLKAIDDDNDTIGYRVSHKPMHGELKGKAPNLTYTPNKDYNGKDSFTFIANDGQADSNEATIDIAVNSVNDKPKATNDQITLDEDTNITINPLENDTDVDIATNDDKLAITEITNPSNGKATLKDNTITYIPNPNYNGNDSLEYTIKDKDGASSTATIDLTINPVNDAPVAEDDNVTTDEDKQTTITLNATDVDGDKLTYRLSTKPKNGTYSINDNKLIYTPNKGYRGVEHIEYVANDGKIDSAPAKIDIKVYTPDITPPVITLNGDKIIKLSIGGIYKEPGATANDNRDGNISVVISGDVNTSKNGNYTVTYTATDSSSNSNSITRTVRVYPKAKRLLITINKDYQELDTTNKNTISLEGEATSDLGIESVECTNEATSKKLSVSGTDKWSVSAVSLIKGDNIISCEATAGDGISKAKTSRIITYDPNNDFASSLQFKDNAWFPEDIKRVVAFLEFKSPLPADTTVSIYEVDANGTNIATVGTMTDDGTGIDKNANDGIYSAEFIANKSKIGGYCYRAGVKKDGFEEYFSDFGCIEVLRRITQNDWDKFELIENNILQIEKLNATPTDKIYNFLKNNPEVDNVVMGDNGTISFKTKGGITSFYAPSRKGVKASPIQNAKLISPYLWDFGLSDDYFGVWQYLLQNKDIYFKPTNASINTEKYSGAVTLDDFESMLGYGYIHISSHGEVLYRLLGKSTILTKLKPPFTSNDSVLFIPRNSKQNILNSKYSIDIAQGTLIPTIHIDKNVTVYGITPEFVSKHTLLSDGTIVILSACRSAFGGYSNLSDAFLSKGASVVLGYTDYVRSNYTHLTSLAFIKDLYKGKTTGEAYSNAVSNFPNDKPKATNANIEAARFVIFGDKTLKLNIQTNGGDDNSGNGGGDSGGGGDDTGGGNGSDNSAIDFNFKTDCTGIEFPDPIPDTFSQQIENLIPEKVTKDMVDKICKQIKDIVDSIPDIPDGVPTGGGVPK